MMDFGRSLGLETTRDEVGNVLIKKPATAGREDHPTLALQSHLDMVHQKNSETTFDFSQEGIRMSVEGDWVKAEGTTLGADNGIGVAYAMAILASKDLPHPPLEALFTIDEETGMTGAKGLKGGLMSANYLLNLDTEDDKELCIGCAGGVDVVGNVGYSLEDAPEGSASLEITLGGLTGGHSGMEIHLGRANANKLMNRALRHLSQICELRLVELDGGGLRNAIPRESRALVAVPEQRLEALMEALKSLESVFSNEYQSTDSSLRLSATIASESYTQKTASLSFTENFLRTVYTIPNGIYRLSPDVEGLVQTSSNLARILLKDGSCHLACLVRGSVDTEKLDMSEAITCALEQLGAEVQQQGEYPGWAPKPDSEVLKVMREIYSGLFGVEPHVMACHAGLECGILGQN